jgi:hypothetical protein
VLEDLTVAETEAVEVLERLDAGEAFGDSGVLSTGKEHERGFVAGALGANDPIGARIPGHFEG